MTTHHERHPIQEYVPDPSRPDLAGSMDRVEVERDAPWKIDWSFGLKDLIGIITVVLSCTGTYYGIKGEIQDGRHDMEMIAARVAIIEHGRAENIPRLEEQIRMNGIQDQRIQNLTESLASLRTTVADLARIVAGQSDLIHEAHERQAVLEERIGHMGPHDR